MAAKKAHKPKVAAPAPVLKRQTFKTSRLLEFCSIKELVAQTGHPVEEWPLVVLKELADNALDACEEAGVAPEIKVSVNTRPGQQSITVFDNGPGLPATTVDALVDFSVRASSREAYASPTRGAQGNALKTLIAMPYALDGTGTETIVIEAHGVRHRIKFAVDPVRQQPEVVLEREPSAVRFGTEVTVRWPDSACAIADAKSRFLQIADDYTWLNPHLSMQIIWDGERQVNAASYPEWIKWNPSDPTTAHWYDAARLERLMAAYVADDQDRGRSRTVREFIGEFRGLSGTAKQKAVLEATGMSRMSLADLFNGGKVDKARIGNLLGAMQDATRPVKPVDIGVIGKEHFVARFESLGVDPRTFQYKRTMRDDDGIPAVIEVAFGYCPKWPSERRIITGVNWSIGINNPFRQLGQYGESLDTFLTQQRADRDEPIVLVVHLACARIEYTDRGKSALALRGDMSCEGKSIADEIIGGLKSVTKAWAKQRKAEERHSAAKYRRLERLIGRGVTTKEAAEEIMEEAYFKASANDTMWATARQVMYAARKHIQERTGKQLDDAYFTQTLLPNYINEYGVDWKIAYDDRGHFTEPHSDHDIGLGTLNVRRYLGAIGPPEFRDTEARPARVITHGPVGRYNTVLFCEKEGFMPLFEEERLAERFDLGIMSTKGMSVTAARELIDTIIGEHEVRVLVLHDFDKAGLSILATLQRSARRYSFQYDVADGVIDLGLRLKDVQDMGLEDQSEPIYDKGSVYRRTANLATNGATRKEIEFLLEKRVELNAMTSPQLMQFIERKLKQHGVKKIVPNKEQLAEAYRLFERGRRAENVIEEAIAGVAETKVTVPKDLEKRVRMRLKEHPEDRWCDAVAAIVGMKRE